MSHTIPQRELRNQNAQILDAVAAGATFIITRNGEPVAELRPFVRRRRQFVPRADIAVLAAEGPHIDASTFRHDLDDMVEQRLMR